LYDYNQIYGNMGGGTIASILEYSGTADESLTVVPGREKKSKPAKGIIGIIGSGNFTKMTLLPALKNSGAFYKYISSAGGLTAKSLANKYGFSYSTTNYKEILNDSDVDLVLITTRHNLHATMVSESLQSGKNVFVEKPLALNMDELNQVIDSYNNTPNDVFLNVGFNRRFSPYVQKMKLLLGATPSIMNIIATINAGFISSDVWVQDMETGGGRIVGEACHFIDLMIFLSGSKVKDVVMSGLGTNPSDNTDNAVITLKFENGTQGVINYFSNGSKSYSKERLEVYSQGRVLILDNFRKLEGFGFSGFSSISGKIDKGHKEQFKRLIKLVQFGGEALINLDEIVNSSKASFAAIESLQTKTWINLD